MTTAPVRPVQVAVFTGSRADLGPLTPVIAALHADPAVAVRVLHGLGHDRAGLVRDLAAAGVREPDLREVAPRVDAVTPEQEAELGAALAAAVAPALAGADVLVVLGDRWELLSVVPSALLLGVRLVHLHGGEVSEGAIDDRIRHAVTKLADQHCVATAQAAERVAALGEPADRIHRTGAPGLDRLRGVTALPEDELAGLIGRPVHRPLALFTYHPPTAITGDAAVLAHWAGEALAATADVCPTVVVSAPGLESGGAAVAAALAAVAADRPGVVLADSFGPAFPALMASADVMVGNSSSGIVEAASLRLPVVNVGDRQRGRQADRNVVPVAEGRAAVAAGLAVALDPGFRPGLDGLVNSYGDGHASPRIVDVVVAARDVARAKAFVDRSEGKSHS